MSDPYAVRSMELRRDDSVGDAMSHNDFGGSVASEDVYVNNALENKIRQGAVNKKARLTYWFKVGLDGRACIGGVAAACARCNSCVWWCCLTLSLSLSLSLSLLRMHFLHTHGTRAR